MASLGTASSRVLTAILGPLTAAFCRHPWISAGSRLVVAALLASTTLSIAFGSLWLAFALAFAFGGIGQDLWRRLRFALRLRFGLGL